MFYEVSLLENQKQPVEFYIVIFFCMGLIAEFCYIFVAQKAI